MMHRLLRKLCEEYRDPEAYHIRSRVFDLHFELHEKKLRPKADEELSVSIIYSLEERGVPPGCGQAPTGRKMVRVIKDMWPT